MLEREEKSDGHLSVRNGTIEPAARRGLITLDDSKGHEKRPGRAVRIVDRGRGVTRGVTILSGREVAEVVATGLRLIRVCSSRPVQYPPDG